MGKISILIFILSFAFILSGCGSSGGGGSYHGGWYPIVPNTENADLEVKSGEYFIELDGDVTQLTLKMLTGAWTAEQPKVEAPISELSLSSNKGNGIGEIINIKLPKNTRHANAEYTLPIYSVLNKTQIATIKINHKLITEEKPWLFVTYIAGDNNLTEYQLNNLKDMETIGSDENTHMVAFIDIGEGRLKDTDWEPNIDWTGAKAFYITKNEEKHKINSEVIKNYGDIDSGSAETFESFLTETLENFPSTNIVLVLNNHGGAYLGSMSDDANGTTITNPDLKNALLNAENATGRKIDVLGFDACLMASLECIYEFRNTADFICVSQELIGGSGWDYEEILKSDKSYRDPILAAMKHTQEIYKSKIAADVTPEVFADSVVTMATRNYPTLKTFSAIRTVGLEKFNEDLKIFSDAIIEKVATSEALKEELQKMFQKYYNKDGVETDEDLLSFGNGSYGLCDITAIFHNINRGSTNRELRQLAYNCWADLHGTDGSVSPHGDPKVIFSAYHCSNMIDAYKMAYGISIFVHFTKAGDSFAAIKDEYMAHEFASQSSWVDMLKALELIEE